MPASPAAWSRDLEVLSCAFSSPARPVTSVPRLSPSCSTADTRSPAWLAPTLRPPRSRQPARPSFAATSTTWTVWRPPRRPRTGVVHLAFKHELDDLARAAVSDLAAVEAIGAALEGTGKPFVITSGTLLLAFAVPGQVGTEDVVLAAGPRADSENAVVAMAERGVRSSVVRLAPLVHSPLDHHGFTHRLIDTARRTGVSAYVGDGSNRWSGLHTLDAATLYRAAVERAPGGSRLHGVEDEGVPFREIADTLGRHLRLPVRSIAPEEADADFGFLGPLVALDGPASNVRTRALLGWGPTHPGLLADLDEGHYFMSAA